MPVFLIMDRSLGHREISILVVRFQHEQLDELGQVNKELTESH